ncbi:hypothetical protein [Sphingomonas endolithica]|uniref:hypothetical protein n=1 Tax=Sphingomonas endolithica TaxID=2972485 RepID=UPI0021AFD34B|nr:hypothetical protein [Sphingomonas sp. ZFBP2030]
MSRDQFTTAEIGNMDKMEALRTFVHGCGQTLSVHSVSARVTAPHARQRRYNAEWMTEASKSHRTDTFRIKAHLLRPTP